MVDPATGTGTFLVEWLRRARKSFEDHHKPVKPRGFNTQSGFSGLNTPGVAGRFNTPGKLDSASGQDESDAWHRHARDNVLPSIHAFELMLAPYAIAHLKIALELSDTTTNPADAKTNERSAQILLTDTLDYTSRQGQLDTMGDPIAEEGERAAQLKEHERFTVVIGNPPYNREHRAVGDTGKRKGGVVRHGAESIAPLLNAVTEPMKDAGLGGNLTSVYNDYVYFWRWAVWQAAELPDGPGVIAFITAASYLDGKSMGGLRHLLREAFDELWIADLGGEGRGAHKDDNIFDIQTPVAIAIGARTGRGRTDRCIVRYLKVNGARDEKLAWLRGHSLSDIPEQVPGKGLDRMTPRSDAQYYDWPVITDLFPWIHAGSKVHRLWPIAETKSVLNRRWQTLVEEVPRKRGPLLKETSGRNAASTPMPLLAYGDPNFDDALPARRDSKQPAATADARARLRSLDQLDRNDPPEGIKRYGYRSFDRQWIIADNRLADRPRPDLWRVRGPIQVFLTTLTSTKLGRGPALTATPYVPDFHHFSGRGARNVIPLYRDPDGENPNITPGLLNALRERLGTEITAENLLAYTYALAGTPAFTEQFQSELTEAAGPIHIPITAQTDLFQQAVALGRDLLWWHTWGERFAPEEYSRLPEGRAEEIRPVEGMPEKVKDYGYDPETRTLTVGTGVFAPVSQQAWDFEVSGLRVLYSWLGYRMKNRRGRKSSDLDKIRPARWTQTGELLLMLSIVEHTIKVTPEAADLLSRIIRGPLILATDLPTPKPADRKPLKKHIKL